MATLSLVGVGLRRTVIVVVMVVLAVLAVASPASASYTKGKKHREVRANTDLVLSSTGYGHGVSGFIADVNSPFDPVAEGYPKPSDFPLSGFTAQDEEFAGIINATPPGTSQTIKMYCIDIRTLTYIGVGYTLGTWDAANVPNTGYVARVLNDYYPNTNLPSSLNDPNDRAAAVQAAVWFFSDRYVLDPSDPLYGSVAAIVSAVIAAGPLTQVPPSLAITPSNHSGPAGSVLGPYTVTSSVGAATVAATGANMFSDAGATSPIANGTTVDSGTQIWLQSTGPSSALLVATATATVPTGNVYLYDGNSNLGQAQKLILAQTATLRSTVSATAEFQAPGYLKVLKTITGSAAGQHGQVVIHSVCDGTPLTPDLVVPAGETRPTGALYSVPAGSVCTVTETVDGSTSTVTATVTGGDQQVTVPTGGVAEVDITDSYDFIPGSLVVTKTVTGPAAGSQDAVTVTTTCDGRVLSPALVIPANSGAGEYSQTYNDLGAGSVCTVHESPDGSSSTVTVTTTGNDQTLTVPAAGIVNADVTDDYEFVPGSLTIEKTLTGAGAGQQGAITITPSCDGTALTPWVIAAGTGKGTYSTEYPDIAAGSECTVIESGDGANSKVADELSGSDDTVTIPPAAEATVQLTDTYVTGDLVINKEIAGTAAGLQGAVTIDVSCVLPSGATVTETPFTIDAGAAAAPYSQTYPGVAIEGATCTVTESVDGSTSTVSVVTVGSPQTVPIPANGTATADITDTYTQVPGSLVVNKTITGAAAGKQGEVTIQAACDGELLAPEIVIPAKAPAGTTTHTYSGIDGGAKCVVTEIADGGTKTVDVAVEGLVQHVTIPANGTATASITDTYTEIPGALMVSKTITGPAAGSQGMVTITATCGAKALPDFVIPAGTKAGTFTKTYDDIPVGARCTVTETDDGGSNTILVTTTGAPHSADVPAATVVPVAVTDEYSEAPGTLALTKTITGPAAGQQGAIAIEVICGGTMDFSMMIPAGANAGSVEQHYNGIPAGSSCVVRETAAGSTESVAAAAEGSGQRVTIPAAAMASAHLTDTFRLVSSSVSSSTLPFTGAGPAAAQLRNAGLAILVGGALLTALGFRRRRTGRRRR